MSNENKKTNEALSNFWKKTTELGKKAADSVQKGAKSIAEQTQKNIQEKRIKKYNPIFPKDFKAKGFDLPNIIELVDDVVRRNIDICDGAIGWIDVVNEIEVFHLYNEWREKSGIEFIPVAKCNNVYYVDHFDNRRYIDVNSIFGSATEERLAELEHIAYFLGAKSCAIEIVDATSSAHSGALSATVKANAEIGFTASNKNMQSGKVVSCFEGNNTPKRPNLKWFAHDSNIKGLIEMRCTDSNAIKSKVLELYGSSTTTMSQRVACAIDKIAKDKGSMSMEKQAIKEHNSRLIFEIEF